ncbi:MAG: DUF1292 domain-containing protein [Clostridia bacterium]|nr:DUF1292 domain-containing protein [Clostridia bacterium]
MDIIEKILDENNIDDIVITNEETGEEVLFEQIATIPFNETVYALLSPKFSNEYFEEGEGVVFKIIQENGDDVLIIEDDEEIIDKIFNIYEDLYRESYGNIVYDTEEENKD